MEEIIEKLPFYQILSKTEKQSLSNNSNLKSFNAGAYFYGYSDECVGLIYVVSGSIRVYITSAEGREITLFHIKRGETCVLSASCVVSQLSIDPQFAFDVDSTVLMINTNTYLKLMESNLEVKCFTYELITKRLSLVLWALQEILFKHVDQRVAHYLLVQYQKSGERTLTLSQEQLSLEINTAREVVTRMLKHFVEEGIISISRNTIKIVDLAKLKAIE